MRTALPVNRELKGRFLRICPHDDFFYDGTEDHFLECRWTVLAVPYLREVFTHRQDSSFFFGGQRVSFSIEVRQSLLGGFDPLQLLIPAPLQLASHETIPGIYGVVLLEGLSSLVLQLVELAGQSNALCRIAGTEFLQRP